MLRRTSTLAATFIAIAAGLALAACSKTAEEPKEAAAEPAPAPAAEPAPAPKRGEQSSAFTVGELPAMALRDGGLELPNDNKVFGVGRTPEEVAALLGAAGQPTDKLALTIQPLLVKTTDAYCCSTPVRRTNFGPGCGSAPGVARGSGRRSGERHGHFHLALAWRSRGWAGRTPKARWLFPTPRSNVQGRVEVHVHGGADMAKTMGSGIAMRSMPP